MCAINDHTGVVAAPTVDNVVRTGTITAGITFSVPPSEQNADHFEVRYYTSSGPTNANVDILVSTGKLAIKVGCVIIASIKFIFQH